MKFSCTFYRNIENESERLFFLATKHYALFSFDSALPRLSNDSSTILATISRSRKILIAQVKNKVTNSTIHHLYIIILMSHAKLISSELHFK